MKYSGRFVVSGTARGEAVCGKRPLNTLASFLNALVTHSEQGIIGDPNHDLFGTDVKGKILVVPTTIGSTTAGLVFLEAIRQGIAPQAVVVREIDTLLAAGAILSAVWFNRVMPVVEVADQTFWQTVRTGVQVALDPDAATVEVLG
ncbi:MAG: hypothetical protein PWQ41_1311 [Bacillota bacterium]|jgi:predicted aconitase with swiveling domain|nr:hypothetical protein [Bacillota bacterium]MDK2856372.1 hypothetical protein [Bacillota bacterium]MDK2925537.1 hypothetical protein [Bacillota bacterium]